MTVKTRKGRQTSLFEDHMTENTQRAFRPLRSIPGRVGEEVPVEPRHQKLK